MPRVVESGNSPSTTLAEERMATTAAPPVRRTPHTESDTLAEVRTGLAFQRTRLSADRTLMAVIRTSMSLISFGFTIYKLLEKLKGTALLAERPHSARNFSLAMILLGVGALLLGIVYHLLFMRELRSTRNELTLAGMLRGKSRFPVSMTLIVALCLVMIGVLAVASIGFETGPF